MGDEVDDIVIREDMLPLGHDFGKIHGSAPEFDHPKQTHIGNHIHILAIGMDPGPGIKLFLGYPVTISFAEQSVTGSAVLLVKSFTVGSRPIGMGRHTPA